MSQFDDYPPIDIELKYGGLPLSEVLSTPVLARQYGLVPHEDESEWNIYDDNSKEIDLKTLLYFVGAQAISVALILGFTFLF